MLSNIGPNIDSQETANLVTFTNETLNGKLHFFMLRLN